MYEAGFTKLFSTIVTSTIWQEDKETKILWITMLALANRYGEVGAAEPGLANAAGLTLDETLKSLKKLESPDLYSRNQDHEGRRVAKIEGGWQILNYAAYRRKMRTSRAEYFREYRRRNKNATQITNSNPIAEAEAEAEYTHKDDVCIGATPTTIMYTLQQVKDSCILNGVPESNAQSYFDQYNSQDWKKGNGQPITNLQSHIAKRWLKSKQCWDFDERKNQTPPLKRNSNGLTPRQRYLKEQGDPDYLKG